MRTIAANTPTSILPAEDQALSGITTAVCDPFSRRRFVAGSLAVGFILAAGPVMADTAIVTDSIGLATGEAMIPVAGGNLPAYYARPAEGGPFATVLVVQEIFGVHGYIQDVCRRLAKQGYLAAAPELYFRQADMSKVTTGDAALAVMKRVSDEQVMGDLDATAAWATAAGQGDAQKLTITGFCWGGRITWLYAVHNPRLRAAVAWYGFLAPPATPLTPEQPMDLVDQLQVPVLALMGGADKGNPPETIERMREKLRAAHKEAEIVVYPDAPHAFHADYRPSYRREAAEDGWRRLLAWFAQHGAA